MQNSNAKRVFLATLGVLLLVGQGCSTKWLSSGGSEQSSSPGSSSTSPGSRSTAQGGGGSTGHGGSGSAPEGGSLRGINPLVGGRVADEERVGQQGTTVAKVSAGQTPSPRRRAELTKEEAQEEADAEAAGMKDVFFAYDSWTISDEGSKALLHDAAWLKQNPKAVIRIEGHCDERGNQDYNLVLGEKRAKAARGYLIDLGVNPKQVAIVSYGEERPFCVEQDESCYQENRRGHMLLRTK